MELKPDIKPLFSKMQPVLKAMDLQREQVVGKFRPLMIIFIVYLMICLLLPYIDLGVPRSLKGNLFYFLMTIGAMFFLVVVSIYFRTFREMQDRVDQLFYSALSRHLADDLMYLQEAPGFDEHASTRLWMPPHNHFEARNLIEGFLGNSFTFAQVEAEYRYLDPLKSDKKVFSGLVLTFAIPEKAGRFELIAEKDHPVFEKLSGKISPIARPEGQDLTERYCHLSHQDEEVNEQVLTRFYELDDLLKGIRLTRRNMMLVMTDRLMILGIPLHDRFWERINWTPYARLSYLDHQIVPIIGAARLSEVI